MFPKFESNSLAYWQSQNTFSEASAKGDKPFVFFEGPPTANGKPGVHHVLARTVKDAVLRYKTMQGYAVPRRAGWDCHGLPVELGVEKALGLTNKQQVEEYGLAPFSDECRASVDAYSKEWEEMTNRMGFWVDQDNAYKTMDWQYMESVWASLKTVWDKDRVYQAQKVTAWCPRCQTTLSSHELAQPGAYQDREDRTAVVRFQLQDFDLVAWTTTPWTLSANQGLAVNPEALYDLVETDARPVVVAQNSELRSEFGKATETMLGEELVGHTYKKPFENGSSSKVVAAEWVGESGTGVVHLAPAFGQEDADTLAGVPVFNPLGLDGVFTKGEFVGHHYEAVNDLVLVELKQLELLVLEQKHTHSVPHCWRCDTRLVYYGKTGWYAKTSELRQQMMDANETVNWFPDHVKHGRFGKWLENNVDWALSRERYWGTPLPFWVCENNHQHCVGSKSELEALTATSLSDLHRASVDDLVFSCSTCQKPMKRVKEVLDVWYDSGAMPWASVHYPFENDGPFVADFVAEGMDQTRGWFYSMMAVSQLMDEPVPYKNVMCLGLVVDENGKKMSKSLGNTVDPLALFDETGADPLRWFYLSKNPANGYALSESQLDVGKQTMLTVNACLDFFLSLDAGDDHQSDEDAWLLARLNETVAKTTKAFDDYDFAKGVEALGDFVEDLSNWWLRTQRERLRKGSGKAALAKALQTLALLMSPVVPFFSEHVWQSMSMKGSVHLEAWPTSGKVDDELLSDMESARELVELARTARAKAKASLRQPLAKLSVFSDQNQGLRRFQDLVCEELNIKQLVLLDSSEQVGVWMLSPDFKLLGPRFGKLMPRVKAWLETLTEAEKQALLVDHLEFQLDDQTYTVSKDEVSKRLEALPGSSLMQSGTMMASLDLQLTPLLKEEGWLRSFAAHVQKARKDLGFDAKDKVVVEVSSRQALGKITDWLKARTQAEFVFNEFAKGLHFDNFEFAVKPVAN